MNLKIDAFLTYLEEEKRFSKLTKDSYKKDLCQFFLFLEENNLLLETATFRDIRFYISSLSSKKYAVKSINRKLSSLKSFFKFCDNVLCEDLSDRIDIKSINGLKDSEKRIPSFESKDCMLEIYNKFSEMYATLLYEEFLEYFIVLLIYFTGLRRAEIISIKLCNLDLNNKKITILGKGSKVREVPINENLIKFIEHYLILRRSIKELFDFEFLLLGKKGKKITERFLSTTVKKIFLIHGVDGRHYPHKLRHSFATDLLNEGASILEIKDLLGHSSVATTQIYAHSSTEYLKKVYLNAHPRSKI